MCEFGVYAAINALQNVETGPIYARVIIVDGWFCALGRFVGRAGGARAYTSAPIVSVGETRLVALARIITLYIIYFTNFALKFCKFVVIFSIFICIVAR